MPASACKVCPQFASPGCGVYLHVGFMPPNLLCGHRRGDHQIITAFEVPTLLQALVKLGNSPHRESEGRRWIRQPHITTRQEQYCKYDTSQSRYFSRYPSKLCHSHSLFDKLISQRNPILQSLCVAIIHDAKHSSKTKTKCRRFAA